MKDLHLKYRMETGRDAPVHFLDEIESLYLEWLEEKLETYIKQEHENKTTDNPHK